MNREEIEKALEGLKRGLSGGELVITSFRQDCIELSLVMQNGACQECIVSKDILLAKVRMVLSKVVPVLPKIVLYDPRI